MNKTKLYAAFCVALFPVLGWAGRPFFTDDAALTESRACQVEAWSQRSRSSYDWWVLPACNPFGNFEISAGLATLHQDGTERTRSYALQGKTLLRSQESDDDWSVGFAFGTVHPDHGPDDHYYAYVPLSISTLDGGLVAHFNLGWLQQRGHRIDRMSWGAGAGYALTDRLFFFGEAFGDDATRPTLHTGFSIGLIPDLLALDLTYGRNTELDEDRDFYTIGVIACFE